MKLRAAAILFAALLLVLGGFAGSATAGGNGHGGGDHGQGNGSSQQSSHHDSTTTTTSSGDNSSGVKPSSTTSHDTYASASSDKTKKYGNGQTAGQIATKSGYGSSTLHGPGNSQPHKVNCGGHEVDVHALKHKSCGSVQGAKHEQEHHTTTPTTTTPSVSHEDHKVTICHKTGSATNPYVEITVDEHALKNGHTAAKGDIIPAPASGCPTGQVAGTTTAQTTTEQEQNCTETKVVTTEVIVGVKHFIGPKGSGRYVIIHPSSHSSHYRDKHPDELVTQSVTKTESVPTACPSTTTTSTTTTEVTTTESTETTTTTAAAVAGATSSPTSSSAPASSPSSATPAGGVLGATAPLHSAKPKPAGGVLGATVRLGKSVGSSHLPFTGLPLWIFALVAAGLILIGATARRAGAER